MRKKHANIKLGPETKQKQSTRISESSRQQQTAAERAAERVAESTRESSSEQQSTAESRLSLQKR